MEIREGLTFDDVLLEPGPSEILPGQVETATRFTREISLNIPIVSAAMDTVRKAAWRSPWRKLAGWAFCTAI